LRVVGGFSNSPVVFNGAWILQVLTTLTMKKDLESKQRVEKDSQRKKI
jgi:hypothetical protein